MTSSENNKYPIWHPFTPLNGADPIPIVKAEGIYLYTESGGKIMDAISSWWVNIHGHSQPKIAKAIAKQAKKMEHVIFAGFTHKPARKLAHRLLNLLPDRFSKLFFSDDGSTSTEVALKMAIQYHAIKKTGRRKIIAIDGAYHGDTFGAMSVGGRNLFNQPFVPYLFDVVHISFPQNVETCLEDMKREAQEAAAFIFEPLVQGSAGMRMYSAEVLDQLLSIAKQHNVICIADEVMTGMGRTGKFLACDYLQEEPDIICISKGITGGFLPLGLTAVSQSIAEVFDEETNAHIFYHGHSYTANPLACAAAIANLKLLTSKRVVQDIERISAEHQHFIQNFPKSKCIKDIRSLGTILAIELEVEKQGYHSPIRARIYTFFIEKNILLRPLGNVFYVLPPYCITSEELHIIYQAIVAFIESLENHL